MTNVDDKNTKKALPWMRILLVASLAANLLIVGVVAGAMWSGGPKTVKRDPGGRGIVAGPYGRAFSKEDRAEIRRSFEERKPWFDETRRKMRGFGQEIATAVRVEPFDGDAIRAILVRQREIQNALQDEGQNLMLERVEAMTPEQRAAFADRLEKALRGGKR